MYTAFFPFRFDAFVSIWHIFIFLFFSLVFFSLVSQTHSERAPENEWLDILPHPIFSPDGDSFLLLASIQETGTEHFTHIKHVTITQQRISVISHGRYEVSIEFKLLPSLYSFSLLPHTFFFYIFRSLLCSVDRFSFKTFK